MTRTFIFLWLFPFQIALGQFAVIYDKDGYVNLRESAVVADNVVAKINNGEIVWCFDVEGDWQNVDYSKGKIQQNGYIRKSRIKPIASLTKIPVVKLSQNSALFKKDSIEVKFNVRSFDKTRNKLRYNPNNGSNYLATINGKQIWGTDGNVPQREYQELKIKVGQKDVSLPESAMQSLFEPNLAFTEVYYDPDGKILYVTSLNSDGAGGYAVLWLIKNGIYQERITTIPF